MPTTFKIKKDVNGMWVPDHPNLDICAHADDGTDREELRKNLFIPIEEKYPGEYTLEYDLEDLRGEVLSKIDIRSDALLEGFQYEGITFSLSPKAQIRYEYMDRKADGLTYPLYINSLDDRDMLELQDAEQTREFCHASVMHVLGVVGSGTVQKAFVRDIETIEGLLAYEDPR